MTVVIIAGHHRSGTSMLARIFHRAGLHLGDDLMPGGPSNPHGHFEDMDVVNIHNTILADNGFGWQLDRDLIPVVNDDVWRRMESLIADRKERFEHWGFKDPRVSVLLPLWKHLLPEARIVAVYRHPSSCEESIRARAVRSFHDGTAAAEEVQSLFLQADLALRLWLVSNRALLRSVRAYGEDMMLVGHDALLGGGPVVETANHRWSLDLIPPSMGSVVDRSVVSASVGPLQAVDPELRSSVESTWVELVERTTTLTEPADLVDSDRC